MTRRIGPARWAGLALAAWSVDGDGAIPVDAKALALGFTRRARPDDPIVRVDEADIPGVDGLLFRLGEGRGWAIAHAPGGAHPGRANFTVAHELGHYLMHGPLLRERRCSLDDVTGTGGGHRAAELDANAFAAALLMPLADFRARLPPDRRPEFATLSACAERYRTSLTATTLRWLGFTDLAAVVWMVREGAVVWTRSSRAALRMGAFVSTAAGPLVPPGGVSAGDFAIHHPRHPWFGVPASEVTMRSERLGFSLSLLVLDAPA